MPTNCGASTPSLDQVPDELRKIADELRATAAGRYVLRLYEENRPAMRSQSEIPGNERGRSVRVGIWDFVSTFWRQALSSPLEALVQDSTLTRSDPRPSASQRPML